MIRNRYNLAGMAWFIMAVSLFGAADPVGLDRILRPLELTLPSAGDEFRSEANRVPDVAIPTYRQLGMSDILPHLEEWMRDSIKEEGTLVLTPVRRWNGLRIPAGADWEILWEAPVEPNSRGSIYPEFFIRVEERKYGPWRLAVRAELKRAVWVSQQRLARGDSPSRPAIEAAMVNLLTERGNPIFAENDLSGYEIVQAVGEGRILNWSDVNPRPSVRRGHVVDVSLVEGALQIRMKAQAMEEGRTGDIVAVRNLQSREEFQALVVGENLVRVHL